MADINKPKAPFLFRVTEPTQLADPPVSFSFSLLSTLNKCPKRWQLTYSKYPDINGPYPSPYAKKSVQGQVVHELLRLLAAWLVQHDSPPIGTPQFADAIRAFEFPIQAQKIMDEQFGRLNRNPRAWRVKELGFRELDVRNQVFQLLRSTWKGKVGQSTGPQLEYKNLAEIRIEHPTLPLAGYLDLVEMRPDGDIITDYKSGELAETYRDQVMVYGVLWWRAKNRIPRRLSVVAVSGERIDVEPTEADLIQRERELEREIQEWQTVLQGPAPAKVAPQNCRLCPVKALCAEFWSETSRDQASPDLEVTIEQQRSHASVTCRRNGVVLEITADPNSDIDLASLAVGSRVRVLSSVPQQDGSFKLTWYSEIYRLD